MTRTGITPDMLAILSAPTPPAEVRQRQGPGGKMLDYIDARFVMDRLDEIGPENWQDRYVDRADGSVRCGIGVLVEGEWVWKWDVGDPSDIEPQKGAYSESLKRAAVKWGIARDLYGHTTSSGRGSSSPRPVPVPPRPVVTPAHAGGAGTIEEPPFLADAFGAPAERPQTPGGVCPAHPDRPWKNGQYGWFCSGKAVEGYKANPRGYCAERPTPKWIAQQEVAS